MVNNHEIKDLNRDYEVGVVGAGHITMQYHLPVLEYLDATTISYVADLDQTRSERAASVYGCASHIVDDVATVPACDVVVLATPVGHRAQYIREFAARETPVFSEKPFALDRETHETFLEQTADITCNYTRTEYGSSAQMKRLVETSLFGALNSVEIRRGRTQTSTGKTDAQIDPETRGGQLHEHGSHLFSQLAFVLPEHEFEVTSAEIQWNEGIDVDTKVSIRARDGDGEIPVSFDFSLIRELGSKIVYRFERAVVRYEPADPTAQVIVVPTAENDSEPELGITRLENAPTNHEAAVLRRWVRFLSAVESGTLDPAAQTGLTVSTIISGIYDTAGTWPGKKV